MKNKLLIAFVFLLLISIVHAEPLTSANFCNQIITGEHNYTLSADIDCTNLGVQHRGAQIDSAILNIDCQGYSFIDTYTGASSSLFFMLFISPSIVTLSNCNIYWFPRQEALVRWTDFSSSLMILNSNIDVYTEQANGVFMIDEGTSHSINISNSNLNISGDIVGYDYYGIFTLFFQGCSSPVYISNNNITASGIAVFASDEECFFSASNDTMIGNYYQIDPSDVVYSCIDSDLNGICENSVTFGKGAFGDIVGITDYYPLSQPAPYSCIPDWSCTGYGTCNQSGLQPCNAVSDLNVCGDSYSGDYSEFTPQACEPSPFTYTADDLAPASINAIAKGVLAFARLAVAFFMVGFILWGLGKLGYEKFKGWKR